MLFQKNSFPIVAAILVIFSLFIAACGGGSSSSSSSNNSNGTNAATTIPSNSSSDAVATITTNPSPDVVVETVKQVLSRGGVAIADNGVTLVPAVSPAASWTIDPGLVFNLASEARMRSVSGRFTATQFGQMLQDMGFPFAGVGTPGEQLMAFLRSWVMEAALDPTGKGSATPLFLAAMAKAQDLPVDLTRDGNNPDDLRLSLLEIELIFATLDRMYQPGVNKVAVSARQAKIVHASTGLCDEFKATVGTIGAKIYGQSVGFVMNGADGDIAKKLMLNNTGATGAAMAKIGLTDSEIRNLKGGAGKMLSAIGTAMKIVKLIQMYASAEVMMTVDTATPVYKPTPNQARVLVPVTARAGIPDQAWQDYQTNNGSYSYQSAKSCLASMGMPLPSDLKDVGKNAANWRVAFIPETGFTEHALISLADNTFDAAIVGYPYAMKLASDSPVTAKATVKVKIQEESELAALFQGAYKETKAQVRAKVFTAEPPDPTILLSVTSFAGTVQALLDLSAGWIQTGFPPTNIVKIPIRYHPAPISIDANLDLNMKVNEWRPAGTAANFEFQVSGAWAGLLAYNPSVVTTVDSGQVKLDSYMANQPLVYKSVSIKAVGQPSPGCNPPTISAVPVTGSYPVSVGPRFSDKGVWLSEEPTQFQIGFQYYNQFMGSAHEDITITSNCPGPPTSGKATTEGMNFAIQAFDLWDIGLYTGTEGGVSLRNMAQEADGTLVRSFNGSKTIQEVISSKLYNIDILSINGTLRLKPNFAP